MPELNLKVEYGESDKRFTISVKECPGCITEGTTLAGAFENLLDALTIWYEAQNASIEALLGSP